MALQPYMSALQGSLGIRRPRNKYRDVAESYLSYCKKRKRRASRTRMLKRRMIKLLEKLLSQRDGIHSEYGAKVNNIRIDGISFIEHLSFKAFNEDIRLKDCIRMQQKLMNVRVRCVAADSIYANNANRKFCKNMGYPHPL